MIEEYLKNLIRNHPASMHSPYYSYPCCETCKVCNMDKILYDEIRKIMEDENNTIITRWIVEQYYEDCGIWFVWGRPGCEYRFHSLQRAKDSYVHHMNSFHYVSVHYRFLKIQIEPESIVERDVEETHWLGE